MARDSTTGNIAVLNQGLNPLVNFNFMLRVELMFDLPCKSVKNFTRENEYEIIQEGGLNDYVHMRRKPISRPFTFEVERYTSVDYIDPLPNGADLILPVMLFVSRYPNYFIPGVTARTYVFTGCTVIKKTYGELNAERSGLLTENITIAYREMLCLELPWSDLVKENNRDYKMPGVAPEKAEPEEYKMGTEKVTDPIVKKYTPPVKEKPGDPDDPENPDKKEKEYKKPARPVKKEIDKKYKNPTRPVKEEIDKEYESPKLPVTEEIDKEYKDPMLPVTEPVVKKYISPTDPVSPTARVKYTSPPITPPEVSYTPSGDE